MMNKISLFLMSYKGLFVLQNLLLEFDSSIIDKIISARDSNVKNDYFKEIRDLSISNNIQFYEQNEKYKLNTQYILAISWRWLIKTNKQLIIFHDSILPQYRGFSPLVNSLINNEKYIGVTAIFAEEEYDRGAIIEQRKICIKYPIKIVKAIETLAPIYFDIFKSIVYKINNGQKLITTCQEEKEASYSLWRDDEDYLINWKESASYIRRFIDSVGYPYLGACSFIGDIKYRIIEAQEIDDVKIENRIPGKIIFIKNGNPVVVCGVGLLMIKNIIKDENGESILPIKKLRCRFH